ncbi:MAG: hypothetical protein ABEI99_10340, partial [Halobaculum sp.]
TTVTDGVSDVIAVSTYDLRVSPQGQDTTDLGAVTVEQRSTGSMQLWTTPGSASVSSVSDIRSGIGSSVTRDSSIASGDYLVHEIQAEGLEGLLAVQD